MGATDKPCREDVRMLTQTIVMYTIYMDDNDISLWVFFEPKSSSRSARQMLPFNGKQPEMSSINKVKKMILQ